jgi:hypothetical protein
VVSVNESDVSRGEETTVSAKQVEEMVRQAETLTPEQAEEAQGGSFSWGATQLGTSSHGTGAGAGKVSMQDFHFVSRSGDTVSLAGAGAGKVSMND